MKDCLIPLDIVFVLNGRISKIHRDCQPCSGEECQRYYGPADHVFEFPSGSCENFKEGDQANLYLGTKFNSKTKRNTPCAAGCCGPKLTVKFFKCLVSTI